MILFVLALQAAATSQPGKPPESFSILLPDPCPRLPSDKADIVVCADGKSSQALPLPDEAGPAPGRGANRELSAKQALALQGTPCAARQGGCQIGFGPPIMPIIGALAKAAKSAFEKKPDKTGRVAIPLDDPAPAGRIVPASAPVATKP